MKLILARFRINKDLSAFSKKFADPPHLLLICKLFCLCSFACTQPKSANDVDDSTSSGNAVQNDEATSRNQGTLERLVEMINAVSMKSVDSNDHELTVN